MSLRPGGEELLFAETGSFQPYGTLTVTPIGSWVTIAARCIHRDVSGRCSQMRTPGTFVSSARRKGVVRYVGNGRQRWAFVGDSGNDAAAFALCLCVYRHLSRFDAAYSAKCLEEEFSERQRLAAARRSVTKVMSSSCSHPFPTKE